jgi:hypothetical protein
MTGSKQVDYWTSGTVYECSEIAGSPQFHESLLINYMKMHICIVHSPLGKEAEMSTPQHAKADKNFAGYYSHLWDIWGKR